MDTRQQRIENEWSFLKRLAEANPGIAIPKIRTQDEFLLALRETQAPIRQNGRIEVVTEHEVRLSFARFFPTVPMEAWLLRPIFHPNIHPETGFVCLWASPVVADTVVEALLQLQRMLTCSLFTESQDHVMQPEALEWITNSSRGLQLPLECTPLAKPPSWDTERNYRTLPKPRRNRLH